MIQAQTPSTYLPPCGRRGPTMTQNQTPKPHTFQEIIVPQAMHTHVARRARSEAAREADFDEHRADVRGFGCDGCDGRDYAHYA